MLYEVQCENQDRKFEQLSFFFSFEKQLIAKLLFYPHIIGAVLYMYIYIQTHI